MVSWAFHGPQAPARSQCGLAWDGLVAGLRAPALTRGDGAPCSSAPNSVSLSLCLPTSLLPTPCICPGLSLVPQVLREPSSAGGLSALPGCQIPHPRLPQGRLRRPPVFHLLELGAPRFSFHLHATRQVLNRGLETLWPPSIVGHSKGPEQQDTEGTGPDTGPGGSVCQSHALHRPMPLAAQRQKTWTHPRSGLSSCWLSPVSSGLMAPPGGKLQTCSSRRLGLSGTRAICV